MTVFFSKVLKIYDDSLYIRDEVNMNYIQQLKEDNKELNQQITRIEEGINDLLRYISSDKFNSGNDLDGYVNVRDIATRLNQIKLES